MLSNKELLTFLQHRHIWNEVGWNQPFSPIITLNSAVTWCCDTFSQTNRLIKILQAVEPCGINLVSKNIFLRQSKSICSCDWHILYPGQLPLMLTPSVVWLWSIGIATHSGNMLRDYFYKEDNAKHTHTHQSLHFRIWNRETSKRITECRLCTDKLLNFHWTCILRISSFSKRKIHSTTCNFSFTYLREMFDLVRK